MENSKRKEKDLMFRKGVREWRLKEKDLMLTEKE